MEDAELQELFKQVDLICSGQSPHRLQQQEQAHIKSMAFMQHLANTKPEGWVTTMKDWEDTSTVTQELVEFMRYVKEKEKEGKRNSKSILKLLPWPEERPIMPSPYEMFNLPEPKHKSLLDVYNDWELFENMQLFGQWIKQ